MTSLAYTGERAVPWNPATGGALMYRHAMRYAWAMQFCEGKRVADLGSGAGYGTFMLSWVAREAIGLELAVAAWAFASRTFKAANLRYFLADVMQKPPEADVYVAFELLEHLDNPLVLAGKLDGVLVWSVPILDDSRFHKHVYSVKRAIADFGGGIWYQSKTGYIVPQGVADFLPQNVLGVRR